MGGTRGLGGVDAVCEDDGVRRRRSPTRRGLAGMGGKVVSVNVNTLR